MSQQILIFHIYVIPTNHQISFYLFSASTFFIESKANFLYHNFWHIKSLQRWKTIKTVNKLSISNDYAFYDVISKLFPRVLVWVTLDFSHIKRKVCVLLYKVGKIIRCINVILKGYKIFPITCFYFHKGSRFIYCFESNRLRYTINIFNRQEIDIDRQILNNNG